MARAVIRHHVNLGDFLLGVADEGNVGSSLLHIPHFGHERAIASLEQDHGKLDRDFVLEDSLLGGLVEHALCESFTTLLVGQRYEDLPELVHVAVNRDLKKLTIDDP